VVGTQLQNKHVATALVQIMTCTLSLGHQPSAKDLGCGLPFAPSAVPHILDYGESCNFIQELKRRLRTLEADLKG
jgi:hypothetical protein